MTTRWTEANIPDLKHKTILITGANSGLGLQMARVLAEKNAHVILACRNRRKAEDACKMICEETPSASVEIRPLDLSSLDSVRKLSDALHADRVQIDVLVNNAGIMAVPLQRTADGFEMQIGTNHFGHFALTGLLLDLIPDNGRVVCLSSAAHRMSRGIAFDDINWQRRAYKRWVAYGDSKLANLLFMFELKRRLARAGKGVVVAAAHPGYADTNLQYAAADITQNRLERALWWLANNVVAQSGRMGALPCLYAATQPDVMPGDYFGPDGFMEARGHPVRVGFSRAARDEDAARRLWELSEALTGVRCLSG